jgi:hypothetical protein
MANISILLSTDFESSFSVTTGHGLLSLCYETQIQSGYADENGLPAHHVYDKGTVNFHGTAADLRLLAERIMAAVPKDNHQALADETDIEESAKYGR